MPKTAPYGSWKSPITSDLIVAQSDVPVAFCRKYYCQHLCFDFGRKEKAGLHEFHRLCRANEIPVASELPLHLV